MCVYLAISNSPMHKRARRCRLRLEHLAPTAPDQPTHPPAELELELEFDNHDDIL